MRRSIRYDVNGLGSGEDSDKVVYDKSPLDSILEMTFPIDPRLKTQVKDEIAATSSQLPLEANDSVLSYINFFSTERGRKILRYGMQRSGKYRPMIRRVLDEEGLPQELIYLAQIESAFSPRAISRKRCVGLWQFSVWDGRNRGLEQNGFVDERMDPEKSTRAAAKHLHELYNQFGDWYLAMAAYNCGPACVDRAVQRTGYADFWKLRGMNALPQETTNYVPVILAITIMVKNPKDYGLDAFEYESPVEYETVKIEAPTNVALIADAMERSVSEIRDLNPALLKGICSGRLHAERSERNGQHADGLARNRTLQPPRELADPQGRPGRNAGRYRQTVRYRGERDFGGEQQRTGYSCGRGDAGHSGFLSGEACGQGR